MHREQPLPNRGPEKTGQKWPIWSKFESICAPHGVILGANKPGNRALFAMLVGAEKKFAGSVAERSGFEPEIAVGGCFRLGPETK
jgi:hypothetical protein